MNMKRKFSALAAALSLSACAGTQTGTAQPPAGVHNAAAEASEAREAEMPPPTNVHSFASRYGFDETVSRLKNAVQAKGMTVFALIDHRAAAQKAGLDMQPATVIVFGAPKAGTPLMAKDPDFALRLPLKVLVTETDGQVRAVLADTRSLIADSRISVADVENTLDRVPALIEKTVSE
ncbi:DUF302 domain-containing protein [Neisseria sp. 23W00296]|uniref:DUF302 domain-containing protein n=1 Tax=unclassified Neisseria TaxID=2623750 RepID=UPI0002A3C3C1|nr:MULTISPECIES: DUF302 domain-containing protein [unclassified Neisseria]ASP17972.1 DUF302 domain-containing protein [Neisseria sp. KEM232]EKY05907.1 hypothetical protein HMPREF9120_01634 [Neisseria sp. oral taxon 020 str. F0370]